MRPNVIVICIDTLRADCVRDDDWSVHLTATEGDFAETARVFDLRADPAETKDVAGRNPDAVRRAVGRIERIAGPLPLQFQWYRRRNVGRTMRSFSQIRYAATRTG